MLITIGKVARDAGVGIETVRFYEREGLLAKPDRTTSGYRQYDQEVIDRLRFIKRAKELGFTLKEIKELLSLKVDPTTTCAEVKSQAEEKIDDIANKIRTLQNMKKALVKLTKECSGSSSSSECPILEALEKENHDETKH